MFGKNHKIHVMMVIIPIPKEKRNLGIKNLRFKRRRANIFGKAICEIYQKMIIILPIRTCSRYFRHLIFLICFFIVCFP